MHRLFEPFFSIYEFKILMANKGKLLLEEKQSYRDKTDTEYLQKMTNTSILYADRDLTISLFAIAVDLWAW